MHSVLWSGDVLVIVMMGLVLAEVGHYSHEWAVHVEGGEPAIQDVADKHHFDIVTKIFDDVYLLRHRHVARRSVDPAHSHHHNLITEPNVLWAEQQVVKRRVKRDSSVDHPTSPDSTMINDPMWPQMWYLNRRGSLDMNVEAAWRDGVTGKGVVVTIVDDGLERIHIDLLRNYDPNASYDMNARDSDPMPRYEETNSNRHGTRCAGVVAADFNNSICGVGVAYEASIGGVRMLDGDVTDAVEAQSLAFNRQHIDIYVSSWGPDDDGMTLDGPGLLTIRAFAEGIRSGRGGKGSIFVWAAGNGGKNLDNCNCDGYNSIWTLSISSTTENGRVPWYSEACSSILTTTYSSGNQIERQIITTDLHNSCTTSHTGSSGSAPLAAGICALALQVNRDLTWRDLQHIVVRTSRPENLEALDWQVNGVGRQVSHWYGYGLMDAHGMVELARNWTSVPDQRICEVTAPLTSPLIPVKSFVALEMDVVECQGVNFLEHVQAKMSLTAAKRGDIEMYLISPAGTKSNLLTQRPNDRSRTGFDSWPFLTVHMWGERPLGKWILEIHNKGSSFSDITVKKEWKLIMYGTNTEPDTQSSSTDTIPTIIPLQSAPTENQLPTSDQPKVSEEYISNFTYSSSFLENTTETYITPLQELQVQLQQQNVKIQEILKQQQQNFSTHNTELASILEAHTRLFEAQVQYQQQHLEITQTFISKVQEEFEMRTNNLQCCCD